MRAVLAVLFLASCYTPPSIAACQLACTGVCPEGLTCIDNVCRLPSGACPGGEDAMKQDADDGSVPVLCPMPTMMMLDGDTQVADGQWFVARLEAPVRAVRYIEIDIGQNGSIDARQVEDNATSDLSGPYRMVLAEAGGNRYEAPRLAPSGTEMFVVRESTSGDVLMHLTLNTSTMVWSAPMAVTLQGFVFDDEDPSPPTLTSPRRMVLSETATYTEFEQVNASDPLIWKAVRSVTDAQFRDPTGMPVAFNGHATLTADGYRMIFRGVRSGDDPPNGAWYVQRTRLDQPFPNPARKLPTTNNVNHPYLTPDCKQLFYTVVSNQVVRRVQYP